MAIIACCRGVLERVGLDKAGRTVWYAIWTVVFSGLIFGYCTAISGSALRSFNVEFAADATAGTTTAEEAQKKLELMQQMMTSSITLGALFGCLLAGACADYFGRRLTILCGTIVFGVGANLFLTFAPNFWCLIVARFLLGFEVGIVSTVAPLYLSECSPPGQRGALGALFQTSICIGIWLTSFLGFVTAQHAWRWMFGLGLLFIVPLVGIAYMMPESPRWLVVNGRESDARPMLEDVVGMANVELEIENIIASTNVEKASLLDVFSPLYRKHLIIGLVLCVAQQWTGINAIIYYFAPILESTGMQGTAIAGASVGLFFWNFLTSTVALKYTDSLGRRTLILVGLAIEAGALLVVGLAFAVFSGVARTVVVVIGIAAFIAGFEIGVGPLFFVVISEIYPEQLRASVGGLITGICWLMNFALSLSFLSLNRAVGSTDADPKGWVFFIFAGVALLSIGALMFFLVETKGKSLDEIQVMLTGLTPAADKEAFDSAEHSVVELNKLENEERAKNKGTFVEPSPAAPMDDESRGSRRSKHSKADGAT